MSSTLLLEIGCEELPTSFLDSALAQLRTLVPEQLAASRVAHGDVRVLGTPRRLAVLVQGLAETVSPREEEILGPPGSAARLPDGTWSKAAEGFAKKNGVTTAELSIADTPKGPYVRATVRHAGASTAALLPSVLESVCKRLTFSKSMRWATQDVAFGRPIQWLVGLFGSQQIAFEYAGVVADRVTRGHRFLSPSPITLATADEYITALGNAHALVDTDSRRVAMLSGLETAAVSEGGTLVRDEFLEREVLGLVEEPHVIVGRFEDRFLALPDALIESVMRGHQRYFAVERRRAELGPDGAWHGDGARPHGVEGNRLLPLFLTVVNTARDPNTIRRGNERVMRARLSDASFFVEQDRKSRLDARLPHLEGVAFHAKLGSYGDKTRRMAAIARWLAGPMGVDPDDAARAATLSKADLVTLTVGEFPELQGLMGAFYAGHDGERNEVTRAVAEHYQPRGASDDVAPSLLGATVALADRLDTLVGCLAVGLRPTGSEDPFGLRRVSMGVLRTLLHHTVNLSLSATMGAVWDVYATENGKMLASATAAKTTRESAIAAVMDFCNERLRGMLEERYSRNAVAACMASRKDSPYDVEERSRALSAFWKTPAADDLAIAFRRVFNISREAPGGELSAEDFSRLVHPSEKSLLAAFEQTRTELGPLLGARDYAAALVVIGRNLRAPVDQLFLDVMVNDDNLDLRASRQRMLGRIADMVAGIARFEALD
jgi:glycyl-tRNA synthetase beta chain